MNQFLKCQSLKPKVQMSNVQSNPNIKVQNKCRIYFGIWILTFELFYEGFGEGLTFAKAKNRA